MIYLASPYSDPDPAVEARRFDLACRAAGYLMRQGHHVFSPIAHCHPIAMVTDDMPTDYEYWRAYNRHMIAMADELWVLNLDGWRESVGVIGELETATTLGKPYRIVTPRDGGVHLGPLHPVSDAIPR